MKYLILGLVAALLSACGEKVTYKERPKPTAEQVREQTPAAFKRATQMIALAYDSLPDQLFDVYKEDIASILMYNTAKVGGNKIEMNLTVQYDPGCKAGTLAYITHSKIGTDKYNANMYLCDYFFNRPVNDQAQTIMHELTHALASNGECRAMLVEFWVAREAFDRYEPNDYYWNLNKCYERGFGYYLPGNGQITASIEDNEGSPLGAAQVKD